MSVTNKLNTYLAQARRLAQEIADREDALAGLQPKLSRLRAWEDAGLTAEDGSLECETCDGSGATEHFGFGETEYHPCRDCDASGINLPPAELVEENEDREAAMVLKLIEAGRGG